MGMYDNIYCDFELPDIEVQKEQFQTKSFYRLLDTYRIEKDGTILINNSHVIHDGEFKPKDSFRFYTSLGKYKDNTFKWYEYEAVVENGKVIKINKIE